MRAGILIGFLLAVAGAALFVGVLDPIPQVKHGFVPFTVRAHAPGAEVYVDNVLLGQTGTDGRFDLNLDAENTDVRWLELRLAGHEPVRRALSAYSGLTGMDLKLRRAPVELAVATTPPGAEVWIDGSLMGFAPLTMRVLPTDSNAIRIRARQSGYEPREELVQLSTDGKPTSVDLALVEASPATENGPAAQVASREPSANAEPAVSTQTALAFSQSQDRDAGVADEIDSASVPDAIENSIRRRTPAEVEAALLSGEAMAAKALPNDKSDANRNATVQDTEDAEPQDVLAYTPPAAPAASVSPSQAPAPADELIQPSRVAGAMAQPPPSAPAPTRLRVDTHPGRAVVTINGREVGTSPVTARLREDEVAVPLEVEGLVPGNYYGRANVPAVAPATTARVRIPMEFYAGTVVLAIDCSAGAPEEFELQRMRLKDQIHVLKREQRFAVIAMVNGKPSVGPEESPVEATSLQKIRAYDRIDALRPSPVIEEPTELLQAALGLKPASVWLFVRSSLAETRWMSAVERAGGRTTIQVIAPTSEVAGPWLKDWLSANRGTLTITRDRVRAARVDAGS